MSDHKALLKHSRNYLFANIATKALAFAAIPVYTRLMSVEEYGVVNVFISLISFSPILMTLNTEVAIGRYYFDAKDIDDFKRFVGCSVLISSSAFLLMSLLTVLFAYQLSAQMSFPIALTLSIIPVSLFKVTNSIFCQIYNPMMESRKIAIFSSLQAYLAFGLSVVAIMLLPKDKYYGYVIGNVLAMMLLWGYLIKQVCEFVTFSLSLDHIKYLLNYCLPYLPYSLSGIIIAQFGKIIISDSSGFASAGLYSFASNLSLVMLVFIGLIHQAWNPFYFRYMNAHDYKSIDEDYDLIWRLTLVLGCFVSIFSYEIAWFMGKSEYMQSVKILPILTMGYIFYQWAYVYMRNAGYAKQTIWMGLAVVACGMSNIVFSIWLIPNYGDLGAAVAFALSYLIMFLLTYTLNKLILKIYSPPIEIFTSPLYICSIVILSCIWINICFNYFNFFLFIGKFCLILGISFLIMLPYKERLCSLVKNEKS